MDTPPEDAASDPPRRRRSSSSRSSGRSGGQSSRSGDGGSSRSSDGSSRSSESSGSGRRRRSSRRSSRQEEPLTLKDKIVVGCVAAFGLTTAFLAFVALWEIVPLFGGWPGPPLLPLSGYWENITAKALQPGPDGKVSPANIATAEHATWEELKLSPMASDAWMRLAYIQTLKGPHMNQAGIEALQKSYVVAPFDPVNCGARDVLALNYWPDLPTSLRQSVLEEIKVTWKPPTVVHPEVIEEWRGEVHNPAGQFALLLTIGPPPPKS